MQSRIYPTSACGHVAPLYIRARACGERTPPRFLKVLLPSFQAAFSSNLIIYRSVPHTRLSLPATARWAELARHWFPSYSQDSLVV